MMEVPPNSMTLVALTVPPCTVAVVVMLLVVLIVPKPEAIEPEARAPVPVRLL